MARSRPPRTRVTLVQVVTAIAAFVALSITGGFLVAGVALPAVTVAGSAAQGTADLFEELPQELDSVVLPQQSNIYDRTGKHLLATFYTQNRVVVPLQGISPWLQRAVVSIEDKRFMYHHGVDGEGLLRAAYVNFTSSSSPGGSTLTQQLVKNTLLQKAVEAEDDAAIEAAIETSLTRKIREWRLALAYEDKVDKAYGTECSEEEPGVDCGKEQILEQYLNIAQFGINIYGAEAASQYYFSKPAKDLNVVEAATIAGITQNPSKWNPVLNPQNAQDRRDTVLLTLYQQDWITAEEFDAYTSIPLEDTLKVKKPRFSCVAAAHAPFFCDYVTKIIKNDAAFNPEGTKGAGSDLLYRGGLDIVTTLDLDKQKAANEELRASLPADDPSGWAMALVSLDPKTGEILAMAQNKDFDPAADSTESTAINYAVDRKWGGSRGFSPGSTFKPVILAQWLQAGNPLMQTVDGRQQAYKADSWTASCLGEDPYRGQPDWKPGNVEGARSYRQTVIDATANSVNTAYVNMTNHLDLCEVRDMAETLGFHRADGAEYEIVPSMALGTQNASPMTMAQIAQVFANEGVRCEPLAILSVTDSDGKQLEVPQQDCRRAIDKEVADGVAYAMQEVIKRGSGKTAKLADGRPAAGKTGTSQLNAHTWFMGYTPNLVTTVWLGNPNHDEPGRNIRLNGKFYEVLYGSSLAAPTWKAYMDRALEGMEVEGFDDPTKEIMFGTPVQVPSIVGMDLKTADKTLTDAGFKLAAEGTAQFSLAAAPGTILSQTPNGRALPGSTINFTVATDQRPSWWTKWPSGWDPNVPPADWWGGQWPPAEFEVAPPQGWPIQPTEEPTPDPTEQPQPDPQDGDGDNQRRGR